MNITPYHFKIPELLPELLCFQENSKIWIQVYNLLCLNHVEVLSMNNKLCAFNVSAYMFLEA